MNLLSDRGVCCPIPLLMRAFYGVHIQFRVETGKWPTNWAPTLVPETLEAGLMADLSLHRAPLGCTICKLFSLCSIPNVFIDFDEIQSPFSGRYLGRGYKALVGLLTVVSRRYKSEVAQKYCSTRRSEMTQILMCHRGVRHQRRSWSRNVCGG
jgi:hypothetical protein